MGAPIAFLLTALAATLSLEPVTAQTLASAQSDAVIPWGSRDGDVLERFSRDVFGDPSEEVAVDAWQAWMESWWLERRGDTGALRLTFETPASGAWVAHYLDLLRRARERSADPVSAAVCEEMIAITMDLWTGTFASGSTSALDRDWQTRFLRELVSPENDAPQWMLEPLVAPNGRAARAAAERLLVGLEGLFSPSGNLPGTVVAFNDLVAASSAEFLEAPPAEFFYYKAVLQWLVEATAVP